ncbi:unnamed protein product [Schistosoma rodhaini]|uniref:EGF-like domain-containing protein n=1 Tax=Schistosoma rodhaini TaxID=6188 RepID=A0AA85G7P5_9TREM|nr:unnamed protein product [Schistosoma rodhaini]
MPIFNHCPIQAKDYCQNGGECFYLSGDPSVYMCSCFMPFYGPQCEHKAPGKDKQIEVEEIQKNINNDENNEGFIIKRSVDRAMTLTALIFIVVTFLGMLILAWYISRRRRKDYARWRKMTELAMKSSIKEKSDKQTQITFDHLDEKETSSLNKSIHSLDNNRHFDDGDPEVVNDKEDIEAQFKLAKTNSDHCQKQNDEYSDFNMRNEELSVHNTSNIAETMKSTDELNICKENQFNSGMTIASNTTTSNNNDIDTTDLSNSNPIELNQKKRTKSKRIAPNSNNPLLLNQSVIDRNQLTDTLDDNLMNNEEYADLREETKEIGVNVIKNSHTVQSSNKSNINIRNEVDHNFDQSTHLSIENQHHLNKSYDPIIINTIGRKLTNPNYPIATILSNAILDRPYINADEIHTLFDQHSPNSTLNPYHDLEYYNPMNTKISSTLPRDYKQEIYSTNVKSGNSTTNNNNNSSSHGNNNSNTVHRNPSSRYLNTEYKNNKLVYGPQEPFTVASQHDALLSDLLHRGTNSNPRESRPKSTF